MSQPSEWCRMKASGMEKKGMPLETIFTSSPEHLFPLLDFA